MSRVRNSFTAVLAVSLIAGLAGCAPAKLDVSDVAGIIDVRTPAEFRKSHIAGAINIDYSSLDFLANSTSLIKTDKYLVYGENSDQATAAAADLISIGISDITNLGSLEDALNVLPIGIGK
ncbi:MAG: hypothetical protein RJA78_1044 [Actinomycetota bacterium]|jgi:rhodanese-related sulfurtransferase